MSTIQIQAGSRAAPTWAGVLNPFAGVKQLVSSRELIAQFTSRDLSARNRGSMLGWVWLIAQPLLMLAVYTFVFAFVWNARWGEEVSGKPLDFALTIFAGLIIFEVFSSTVSQAPSLIVNHTSFVKKVVFPLEVLPAATLCTSCILSLVSIVILLIAKLATGGGVSHTLFLLPLVYLPLVLLTAGCAFGLSALGVFVRDIRPIVSGLLISVLFFMTPIFYPLERVPEWMRQVLGANPLAVLVESARRVLVFGTMPDWAALGVVTLVSVIVFTFGLGIFRKSKRGFADVL